jgi:Flp pilus assembly protein TadG
MSEMCSKPWHEQLCKWTWIPTKLRMLSEEDGSILVLASLCMVVLLSILGFAIDVGHLRQVRRQLQTAADAAALAAAIEVPVCGNSPNCSTMQSAAQSALTENNLTATTTLTNCSGTPGSAVTLTINNPACSVATDPNLGKSNYVEAVVSEPVPTYFGALVGMSSITVSARAEGASGVAGPCIYALAPTGAAIVIVAGVIVKSTCGIVDESTSTNALSCVVGAFLYAPSIQVSGGSQGLLCLATSTPNTYVPAPSPHDPLAYLSAPTGANNACGTSTSSPYYGSSNPVNLLLGGNATFNPGVYCGGISLTASLLSNITFNPGTYILRDKAGFLGVTQGGLNLSLSALSTITGNGVTFYNEGPTTGFSVIEPVTGGLVASIANVNLTAPSSGTYSGILFFQAHGVTATGNFLANLDTSSKLQGAVYLPDAPVNYGVSAISSSYNFLVAKDIDLNVAVASSFGNDYSSLAGGSPLDGNSATLVE